MHLLEQGINLFAVGHASDRETVYGLFRVLIALLVVLVLMLLASAPLWPYSREWSFYPSTGIGIVLACVIVLAALHIF